jgi:hypothetical protein
MWDAKSKGHVTSSVLRVSRALTYHEQWRDT